MLGDGLTVFLQFFVENTIDDVRLEEASVCVKVNNAGGGKETYEVVGDVASPEMIPFGSNGNCFAVTGRKVEDGGAAARAPLEAATFSC